jgi:hypothetical protein
LTQSANPAALPQYYLLISLHRPRRGDIFNL